jgi:hypothetical protein
MKYLAMTALVLLPLAAGAQNAKPYAGQERRAIKALSEQETADLLAGRGMGLAKAAELNSYPGPMHVLEMREQLGLDAAQVAALEDQKRRMADAAIALGKQLVSAERELDRLFAERRIDAAILQAKAEAIGRMHGKLRAVHLATHLETRAVLSDAQVRRYDELRGYTGTAPAQPHRHGH